MRCRSTLRYLRITVDLYDPWLNNLVDGWASLFKAMEADFELDEIVVNCNNKSFCAVGREEVKGVFTELYQWVEKC